MKNLEELAANFAEFIEYRELERQNLESFYQDGKMMPDHTAAAIKVLEILKERVEKGDDPDVTKLLTCVVAPRCCIKLH